MEQISIEQEAAGAELGDGDDVGGDAHTDADADVNGILRSVSVVCCCFSFKCCFVCFLFFCRC
jgi:hypothetical protein